MMIDLPTNIRPRWGGNPRIHVWGASASACDARGSSRDTPDFTSGDPRISIRGIQGVCGAYSCLKTRTGVDSVDSGGKLRSE
jgi:hypothetical protein